MTDHRELTVKQVSERLGRTPKTIRNMIDDGRLSARLVSDAPLHYYLITLESLERYEAQVNAKRDQSSN